MASSWLVALFYAIPWPYFQGVPSGNKKIGAEDNSRYLIPCYLAWASAGERCEQLASILDLVVFFLRNKNQGELYHIANHFQFAVPNPSEQIYFVYGSSLTNSISYYSFPCKLKFLELEQAQLVKIIGLNSLIFRSLGLK